MKLKLYIQRRGQEYTETVDEVEGEPPDVTKEAQYLLNEYRLADREGYYYISTKASPGWE